MHLENGLSLDMNDYSYIYIQDNNADPRIAGTPELGLHQLDNAKEISEKQLSGCRINHSTAKKSSNVERSLTVLQCKHCDYTSTRSYNLKVHSRKHTGDLLQCQHCDYTTAYSNSLKEHSRKHTGDLLQCQHCDYTTAYSGNAYSSALKRHSIKHTVTSK